MEKLKCKAACFINGEHDRDVDMEFYITDVSCILQTPDPDYSQINIHGQVFVVDIPFVQLSELFSRKKNQFYEITTN